MQHRGTFIEQARRAQMVQCAVEEIAENGYPAASLAAIARRAGVSRGVISYHFADKDDLVEQVIADFYRLGAAFIGERLKGLTGVRAIVRAFIEANVEFFAAYPVHVRASRDIVLTYRTAAGARIDQRRPEAAQGRAALLDLFAQGQASGDLRRFDREAMATAIRAAVDGAVPELTLNPDFDLTAYGRELATTFDHAIRS
ncbi:TetR/AcrR family transcriptional regulator [Fodinicola feengrottensis]|uniref:TetR family transcriptional regulator n=1 Tax=Fodinicola feengrottensis TaxID=435914 RepID=A0ABP4UND3_9ACTN|nr:TetR family transcriptional regulator [Fodinicola feengrottensis]